MTAWTGDLGGSGLNHKRFDWTVMTGPVTMGNEGGPATEKKKQRRKKKGAEANESSTGRKPAKSSAKSRGLKGDVSACPLPGCDSAGNISPRYTRHHTLSGCPIANAQGLVDGHRKQPRDITSLLSSVMSEFVPTPFLKTSSKLSKTTTASSAVTGDNIGGTTKAAGLKRSANAAGDRSQDISNVKRRLEEEVSVELFSPPVASVKLFRKALKIASAAWAEATYGDSKGEEKGKEEKGVSCNWIYENKDEGNDEVVSKGEQQDEMKDVFEVINVDEDNEVRGTDEEDEDEGVAFNKTPAPREIHIAGHDIRTWLFAFLIMPIYSTKLYSSDLLCEP